MKKLLLICSILITNILFAQVASYDFENGSFIDAVNLNNLTQTGSNLAVETDRFGTPSNAVKLNGDNLSRRDINFSNNSGSISFWIKTTTKDGSTRIIFEDSTRQTDSSNTDWTGYYIFLYDGRIGFYMRTLYDSYFNHQSAVTTTNKLVSDDRWHHIVVKFYDRYDADFPFDFSTADATYFHTLYGLIYIDGVYAGGVAEEQSSKNRNHLNL